MDIFEIIDSMNKDVIKRLILDIKEEVSLIQGKIWDPSDDFIIYFALLAYYRYLKESDNARKMEDRVTKKA